MKVTLKLATSLDGRIATASGESRWITGEAAREQGQRLRAEHDAVLVGVNTVLFDDPALTVRLPGWTGPQPARVILDTRQRTPADAKLVRSAGEAPTYLFSDERPKSELADAGVRVLKVGQGRPDPVLVVEALASEGLASVMVEGGGQVAANFLRAGVVTHVEWFRAPILLGGEGRPGVGELALARLADAPAFRRESVHELGPDLWERYVRN